MSNESVYCSTTKNKLNLVIKSVKKLQVLSLPVVVAIMKSYTNEIPDTIGIEHKNFKFTIG